MKMTRLLIPKRLHGTVEDTQGTQDFMTSVYQTIFNVVSGYGDSDYVVILPMPHNINDIELHSKPISDFWKTYTQIGDLVALFWYFIIGRWFFTLVRKIYLWVVNGCILGDTYGFADMLAEYNVAIKSFMM